MKRVLGIGLCACLWFSSGCSRSNNLLLGRIEGEVGGHRVVVTDCYRTSVPPLEKLADAVYRFAPCRDADIVLRGDSLEVNGRLYGHLKPDDAILVDHSVVSLHHQD